MKSRKTHFRPFLALFPKTAKTAISGILWGPWIRGGGILVTGSGTPGPRDPGIWPFWGPGEGFLNITNGTFQITEDDTKRHFVSGKGVWGYGQNMPA